MTAAQQQAEATGYPRAHATLPFAPGCDKCPYPATWVLFDPSTNRYTPVCGDHLAVQLPIHEDALRNENARLIVLQDGFKATIKDLETTQAALREGALEAINKEADNQCRLERTQLTLVAERRAAEALIGAAQREARKRKNAWIPWALWAMLMTACFFSAAMRADEPQPQPRVPIVAIVEWATEDFTIKEIEQLGFAPTPADCATADLRLLPDYEVNTAKGWIPHLLCGVSAQFYVPVATSKPEPESPCPSLSVNCQDPSGVL